MTPETTSTRRIVAYTIAKEDDDALLIALVGVLISEGWQPFGPLCIGPNQCWFHQAMVRYEEEGQ